MRLSYLACTLALAAAACEPADLLISLHAADNLLLLFAKLPDLLLELFGIFPAGLSGFDLFAQFGQFGEARHETRNDLRGHLDRAKGRAIRAGKQDGGRQCRSGPRD